MVLVPILDIEGWACPHTLNHLGSKMRPPRSRILNLRFDINPETNTVSAVGSPPA